MAVISNEDTSEFLGRIIDIFEDFLEEKGINIDNPEKEEDDDAAIIYGSDYGILQDRLTDLMKIWEIINDETHNS